MKEEFKNEVKRFNRTEALEYCQKQYRCSRNEFQRKIATICKGGKYFVSVIDGYFETLKTQAEEIQRSRILQLQKPKRISIKDRVYRKTVHKPTGGKSAEERFYEIYGD